MAAPKTYPQFLLLGDSIIQFASYLSNGGYQFGAGLSEHCTRRLDVINKGLSGYNTSHVLLILEHLIPSPSCAKVDYLLILLGSNDACLPTSPTNQHVPLDTYRENIRSILTHPSIKAHNPIILLVTPPPINEVHLESESLNKGFSALTRHQSITATYAEAIREAAMEFEDQKVLLVDLWTAMMKEGARLTPGFIEGGEFLGSREMGDSEGLRGLLADGLHLTGAGYALFLKEVLPLVGPAWAEESFDAPNWIFPHWSVAPRID